MFTEGNIIKLGENTNYVVVFSTMYNNENYIFVTNEDNFFDSKFYKNKNFKNLEIVENGEIIKELLNIYQKRIESEG